MQSEFTLFPLTVLETKRCAKCGAVKPVTEFSKQVSKPSGYRAHCKACIAPAAAVYRAANADRIKAYNDANAETVRARATAWSAAHPGVVSARMGAWQRANPEKVRARAARRRAREHNATIVKFTAAQLTEKIAYWQERCWICGAPYDAIDHVKPLAKGGAHALCNLRPICDHCNSTKSAKWPYPMVRLIPRW